MNIPFFEHLGNLGVILLAVLLSTSVHYLFLRHLNAGPDWH